MSIRPDDPRLADFTPEEIARGVPEQIAEQDSPDAPMQYDIVSDTTTVENGRNIRQIQYSNGVVQTQDLGPADDDTDDDTDDDKETDAEMQARLQRQRDAEQLAQNRSNAFSVLRTYLSKYKLEGLEDAVKGIIYGGQVDMSSPDAILFALRENPAYKKRFAANEARVKAGLAELDPATYIGLEQEYKRVLQANGLDAEFYNDQSDYEAWIAGDVSVSELQERVQLGYSRVAQADPEVKRQMKELYGVEEADLAQFFLDPKRAKALIDTKQKVKMAQGAVIGARAIEQGGGFQLTQQEAIGLAERGITEQEAAQAFGEQAALSGLYQEMTGEQEISREDKLGATFRYSAKGLEDLRRRQKQRLAQFQGGGGFSRTVGQTSGSIETGVGLAQ